MAVSYGKEEMYYDLLFQGAKLNRMNNDGFNLAHIAALKNQVSILE